MDKLSNVSSFSSVRKRRTNTNYNPGFSTSSKASFKQRKKVRKNDTLRKSYNSSVTSTMSKHSSEAGLWKKRPNWEEFDNLDKNLFDEDVASATTMNSVRANKKSKSNKSTKKGRSSKKHIAKARMTQNFNFVTSSQKKAGKKSKVYNYQVNGAPEEEDNVEVSIVFQEVDSNFMVNKVPHTKEIKSSPESKTLKKQQSLRKSRVKPYGDQRKKKLKSKSKKALEIKMEGDSFNKDILRQANPPLRGSNPPKPKYAQNDENDETLSLSPIQKSKNKMEDEEGNSFDQSENREQSFHLQYRDTAIRPLYRPPVRRERIKTEVEEKISETPARSVSVRNTPKTQSEHSIITESVARSRRSTTYLPDEGYKDLQQYENFKDDLEPLYEEGSEDFESERDSFTSTQKLTNNNEMEYIVPETSGYGSVKSSSSHMRRKSKSEKSILSHTMSHSSHVKSRIRRYGKNKHERETALSQVSFSQASERPTVNRTYVNNIDNQMEVERDELKETFDAYLSKEKIQPLIKSLSARPKVNTKMEKSNLYEYKIDPRLEMGSVGVGSLREKKYYRRIHHDSLRDENPFSPAKSAVKKSDRFSYSACSGRSSGRKTVRFAETSEGLLKSAHVDPTFNDSDFVYDMQYRVE